MTQKSRLAAILHGSAPGQSIVRSRCLRERGEKPHKAASDHATTPRYKPGELSTARVRPGAAVVWESRGRGLQERRYVDNR